jgi:hypothetical protein
MLGMGRPSYVCTLCSEHFTRRYSAKRHNQNLHNGNAEIVRLIDYLAGRSSGLYTPNHPFWFKQNNPYGNFGPATIPDSIGNAFEPTYLPQQGPPRISENFANPLYRRTPTTDVQSYGIGLSQETRLKIEELKKLVYKYPQHHNNKPDEIVNWAIYCSVNGDDKFLDDKLEQLRSFDSLANIKF